MIPNGNTNHVLQRQYEVVSFSFRIVAAVVFLGLFAVPSAFGQTATYSDSYVVDNSGATYDEANSAYIPSENPGQNEIAGVGVTESDYDGESMFVRTTLTAPDGTATTATQYADPWYSRSEVTLPVNPDIIPNDGTEVGYTVNTEHRYREYYDPSCYGGPCYNTAAYKVSHPLPLYRYFSFFSRFFLRLRIVGTDYSLAIIGPTQSIYDVDCPYGYSCGFRTYYYYHLGQPSPRYIYSESLLVNGRYCFFNYRAFRRSYPSPCS